MPPEPPRARSPRAFPYYRSVFLRWGQLQPPLRPHTGLNGTGRQQGNLQEALGVICQSPEGWRRQSQSSGCRAGGAQDQCCPALWGSILPLYIYQLPIYIKQHPKVTPMGVLELVQFSAGSFLPRVVASRQRPPPRPGSAHRSPLSSAANPQNSIKPIKEILTISPNPVLSDAVRHREQLSSGRGAPASTCTPCCWGCSASCSSTKPRRQLLPAPRGAGPFPAGTADVFI